ncbi:MAG: hypothetical protein AAB276_05675 [Pseudomonadota bacterium]
MAQFLKYIVTFLFVGVIFWVALPNRDTVPMTIYPFFDGVPFSAAIIFVAGIFFGFIWGALIVWLNGADLRQGFRSLRRRLKNVESHQSATRNIMP